MVKQLLHLWHQLFQGKDNHMIRRVNPGVARGTITSSSWITAPIRIPEAPDPAIFLWSPGIGFRDHFQDLGVPDCKRLIWTILLFRTSLRTVFTVNSRGVMAAVTPTVSARGCNPRGQSHRSPLPRRVGAPEDWPSDYCSLSPGGKRKHHPGPNFALPKPPCWSDRRR